MARTLVALLLCPAAVLAQTGDLEKKTVDLPTGITMAYVEAGDPAGEPVLLIHGFTDTSRSFLSTMQALVAQAPDLRVFAIDQRGHGDSSMPPGEECRAAPEACFRVADLAADAIAFLDALGIERAHVAGHSLGSMVAQEIALQHPERVESLVLLGSTARTSGSPIVDEFILASRIEGPWKAAAEARGLAWPADVYGIAPAAIDSTAPAWMAAEWVVEPLAEPDLIAAIQAETEQIPLGTWIGIARALTTWDNTARLKELAVPTLVLWGIQDGAFIEADQEVLRASLPACPARWVWKRYGREPLPASGVPGNEIGHNLQWGVPEAVATDIVGFIRDGRPTDDLHYGDPAGERRVLTAAGEAELIKSPRSCPA